MLGDYSVKVYRIVKRSKVIRDCADGKVFGGHSCLSSISTCRNQEIEREAEKGNSSSASVLVVIISNLVVNDEGFSYLHYRSGTEPVYCALGQCGLRADYVCSSVVFSAARF